MEKSFTCEICQKTFTRRSNLTRHVSNCHRDREVVEKSENNVSMEETNDVSLSNSPMGVFSCNICLQGFTLNSQLQAHAREHEAESGVSSENINSVANTDTKSDEVSSSVESLGMVNPSISPIITTDNNNLNNGPDVASSEVVVTTDVLNHDVTSPVMVVNGVVRGDTTVTPSLINETINTTTTSTTVSAISPSPSLLVRHSSPYSCSICQRGFSQRSHLDAHVRIHSGERPYQCNQCGAAFSRRGNLVRHRLSHGGERKHKCTVCGRRFSQKSHLQVHLRIHTGERPYKCDRCGYAFSRNGNLVRHRRANSSGKRKYSCVPPTLLSTSSGQQSTSSTSSSQAALISMCQNNLAQTQIQTKNVVSGSSQKGVKTHVGNSAEGKNAAALHQQQLLQTTSNTTTTTAVVATAPTAASTNVVQLANVPYQIMTALPSPLNAIQPVTSYHSLANVPHQLVTVPQPISVHQLASLGNIASIPLHIDVPTT
ncbi:zinc finger and SCAN domain-containing protein 2 [Octopus bimaculoides]|uniref:C2H2-type domain-containing protein n=1 Tax=Octopus bimaculoides TaxID=37653 RepID=A0A0L8FH26_OCTBM|nr:zinc finger and SCAN domain-containing protein 2 [Octopus bimaculoides]|eukprot:XP_014789881.1 PREDICTED: zinc finger and SCAN domain-containing protein 2-like [Octopus bimaculoides]